MEFIKGILQTVSQAPSQNFGGNLVNPSLIVVHFTGGSNTQAAINWLRNKKASASAHFVISPDGEVIQLVSCSKQAWHAGVSEWKGRKSANRFSIGIELVNAGLLKEVDGKFQERLTGKEVPKNKVSFDTKNRPWQVYDFSQIQSLCRLIKTICEEYPSISELAGHEDVSPGRKIDPGPLLPWKYISAVSKKPERGAAEPTEIPAFDNLLWAGHAVRSLANGSFWRR